MEIMISEFRKKVDEVRPVLDKLGYVFEYIGYHSHISKVVHTGNLSFEICLASYNLYERTGRPMVALKESSIEDVYFSSDEELKELTAEMNVALRILKEDVAVLKEEGVLVEV